MTDDLMPVERLLMRMARFDKREAEAVRLLIDVARDAVSSAPSAGGFAPDEPEGRLLAFARSLGGDPR